MTAPNDIVGAHVTLDPAEYVRFLGMLEQRLPAGTRAYMVTLTDDGRRELTPVPDSAAVIDIKNGLVEHLRGRVILDDDWLIDLRDYCNQRLERQGGEARSLAVRKAAVLTNECAQIAGCIRDLAGSGLNYDSDVLHVAIERLSAQLGWTADLAADELNGIQSIGDAKQWMLRPAYHELKESEA